MGKQLPETVSMKVGQSLTLMTKRQVDDAGRMLCVYSEKLKITRTNQNDVVYGPELFKGYNRYTRKTNKTFTTTLSNEKGTHAVLALVDMQQSMFELLGWARKIVAETKKGGSGKTLRVNVVGDGDEEARVVKALILAFMAGQQTMPRFKSEPSFEETIDRLAFYGLTKKINYHRELAEAEGNYMARWLTALPANYLTPKIYQKKLKTLAKEHGWSMHFYDMTALKNKKAGAFLAVCQGSQVPDAGIVHLVYRPTQSRRQSIKKIALVGKGICFDTGGNNLKPARYMVDMHEDMEGSAVALGTLMALTKINYPYPVDCWLALAQNHIGPDAYKQSDVVTAVNGTTIEVVHTDAEGRMVLADTLALASQKKPDLIIDYATLTGACVQALGSTYTGAFTNREHWWPDIIAAGHHSGERVWPFPLDKDFEEALESPVADIKQCTLSGEADHILAARFLQRFVSGRPWIHLDLSAGKNKGGLAHIPTDITGFGVRFTLDLLLDKKILTH